MKLNILFARIAATSAVAILSSCASDGRADLLGDAATGTDASRTISIGPNTAYVNVTDGDIVKFIVDDKIFVWNFDGPSNISEIDLNKVAPPGRLNRVVKAYIDRNPDTDGS